MEHYIPQVITLRIFPHSGIALFTRLRILAVGVAEDSDLLRCYSVSTGNISRRFARS